jgi:hypothetical protein
MVGLTMLSANRKSQLNMKYNTQPREQQSRTASDLDDKASVKQKKVKKPNGSKEDKKVKEKVVKTDALKHKKSSSSNAKKSTGNESDNDSDAKKDKGGKE